MEKFLTAFATDDGINFIDRHFGDAAYYDVYEISSDHSKFLKRITNTTEEDDDESGHGDAEKAKGIAGILKAEGVQMAVSKVFGPNLKRIKKKFLCVMFKSGSIETGIETLKDNYPSLVSEWEKGEERTFLRF
jgi:predicted Fe-Mo cluster-binding NifX family protein